MASLTAADIIFHMNAIAPPRLAEKWDNVGLQIGSYDTPVNSLWIALDPLPEVVASACDRGVAMLITHHPLFFKPLNKIDYASPVGKVVQRAVRHGLVLFSAHTNLDSVKDGVNDVLAKRLGLKDLTVLSTPLDEERVKLVIFVPPKDARRVQKTLFAAGAGHIGNYSECSFATQGQGSFRSGVGAQPALGEPDRFSQVDEVRLETVVPRALLSQAIASAAAKHPYETMAWDAYPLVAAQSKEGLGRLGCLPEPTDLAGLARSIKETLNLKALKVAGSESLAVEKVAICSGSGSSLIGDFLASDAQVYISGDLGYHDAQTVTQHGKGLIDMGHFHSEHLVVDALAAALQARLKEFDNEISIEACPLEEDPYTFI